MGIITAWRSLKTILDDERSSSTSLLDVLNDAAHDALLRLDEMPQAVCRFLEKELPRLQDICVQQNRRLIVTTDHGLSLTRSGFSHGKGGVYERAVFRAEWRSGHKRRY